MKKIWISILYLSFGMTFLGCEDEPYYPEVNNCSNPNFISCHDLCVHTSQIQYCSDLMKCTSHSECSEGEQCIDFRCLPCLKFTDEGIEKYALKKWDYNDDACIDIKEAVQVYSIPECGLCEKHYNVKHLDDLNMFPNLKTIGKEAFKGKYLKTVHLNHVTHIEDRAFYEAHVESVKLPEAVSIGEYAFYSNYELKEIYLPKLTEVKEGTFSRTSISEFYLPEATYIGGHALFENEALRRVDLPKAEMIKYEAFYKCKNLAEINLPKLKKFGPRVFYDSIITEITLPELTIVPIKGFANCKELTTVNLPKVTYLAGLGFYQASKLKNLILSTPDEIGYEGMPFHMDYDDSSEINTKQVTLVLHKNKSPEGDSKPLVEGKNNWVKARWKEIIYVE